MPNTEEHTSDTCIFCKIIAGDIPTHVVYEDSDTLAFLDAHPVNVGHTLVVPKRHCENIHDTPVEVLHKIIATTKKISDAVKEGVQADGINIYVNNGSAAGQVIFHTHFHIIPRFNDDGLQLWQKEIEQSEEEKKATARAITSKLS